MTEKAKTEEKEPTTAEDKPEKEKPTRDTAESQDPKEFHPPHSAGYIKDKKTGKWKIVNPAGSMVYNYLNRDEFPDE
jgi:hypothetical protein